MGKIGMMLPPGPERPLRRRRPRPPEPPEGSPQLPTVPWDPDAEGHIKGSTVRAVRLAAAMALAEGWSAERLRRRPQWLEQSVRAALVRTAVRWGLIP